jgi:hypothetical protein
MADIGAGERGLDGGTPTDAGARGTDHRGTGDAGTIDRPIVAQPARLLNEMDQAIGDEAFRRGGSVENALEILAGD